MLKLLNKMTVSELAELSNLTKSYISQVKHGKCPPNKRLLQAIEQYQSRDSKTNGRNYDLAIDLFLRARNSGVSVGTVEFYKKYLTKALPELGLEPKAKGVSKYIHSLPCSQGGKHAYYRAISVFYNWLYSAKSGYAYRADLNPIILIDPPKVPKRVMPSLTKEEVDLLIERADGSRNKAIISLLAESGLRISELLGIKRKDIDWDNRIIRVIGKGNKEGFAPFGDKSEHYLQTWLFEYQPDKEDIIWNVSYWGIKTMLDDLRKETGLPCNPHTFRRTFACLLRKAGVDTMTIKDLGRWESLEMVQRYTRSVSFHDSMKFYKAPLS